MFVILFAFSLSLSTIFFDISKQFTNAQLWGWYNDTKSGLSIGPDFNQDSEDITPEGEWKTIGDWNGGVVKLQSFNLQNLPEDSNLQNILIDTLESINETDRTIIYDVHTQEPSVSLEPQTTYPKSLATTNVQELLYTMEDEWTGEVNKGVLLFATDNNVGYVINYITSQEHFDQFFSNVVERLLLVNVLLLDPSIIKDNPSFDSSTPTVNNDNNDLANSDSGSAIDNSRSDPNLGSELSLRSYYGDQMGKMFTNPFMN
jgi:hypothetical protein